MWRLFEAEHSAFNSHSFDRKGWYAKLPEDYEFWPQAIKRLVEEGHLDRGRVLDACLSGLFTGLKNDALSGFVRMFDFLEPTGEELGARQGVLRELLLSRVSHVVTFAIGRLRDVQKAGRLDAEAAVEVVGAVMEQASKAQPRAALQLLQAVAKDQPELVQRVAEAAVAGLRHEHPDIQERALKLIDALATGPNAGLAERLTGELDTVAASVREGSLP